MVAVFFIVAVTQVCIIVASFAAGRSVGYIAGIKFAAREIRAAIQRGTK